MDNLETAVWTQLEAFNRTLEEPLDLSAGLGSVLFGPGGTLDSADFVSLVLDMEQMVEDRFGQLIALADERALSQKHSPFRTVGSLTAYIRERLDEAGADCR